MDMTFRRIRSNPWQARIGAWETGFWGLATFCLIFTGCARLPVPTQVIHEDQRLMVRTEQVSPPPNYTHPISLSAEQLEAILKNLSVLEHPGSWPLRLSEQTARPEILFPESARHMLIPHLIEGLKTAMPNEHVAFALYTPGPNPTAGRFVTSGWIALRDPYFHIQVDYVRHLQPQSATASYYPFFRETPAYQPLYDIIFSPPRFWLEDPTDGMAAIHYRDFLRTTVPPGEDG
jgi:hypothetical protein